MLGSHAFCIFTIEIIRSPHFYNNFKLNRILLISVHEFAPKITKKLSENAFKLQSLIAKKSSTINVHILFKKSTTTTNKHSRIHNKQSKNTKKINERKPSQLPAIAQKQTRTMSSFATSIRQQLLTDHWGLDPLSLEFLGPTGNSSLNAKCQILLWFPGSLRPRNFVPSRQQTRLFLRNTSFASGRVSN